MTSCIYGVVRETYELGELRRLSCGIVCYANPEEDGTLAVVASVHEYPRITTLCAGLLTSATDLRYLLSIFGT